MEESFRAAQRDSTLSVAAMKNVLAFMRDNEHGFDAEAKAYADSLTTNLVHLFETGLSALPDGHARRSLARATAAFHGTHHTAKAFLEGLSSEPERNLPILQTAHSVFLEIMQRLLDILYEITRHSHQGAASLANITLLYWCFDELVAAFYLAERHYTTQAYSHLRTVTEHLDKIQLFYEQPNWAEVWGSGDKKTVWNELRPAAVRKKLGKPKSDAAYELFSEIGSHGTFTGLRHRVRKTSARTEKTNPSYAISVGGVRKDEHVVSAVSYAILIAVSTLLRTAGAFSKFLNEEDAVASVKAAVNHGMKFMEQFASLLPKQDAERFLAITTKWPQTRDSLQICDLLGRNRRKGP